MGRSGLLVAFEGIDGAGKTTQVDRLVEYLTDRGVPLVRTKEPTNGPWGTRIRQSAVTGRMSPNEELEAFLQDRREHVRQTIAPALADGQVVVVDRYYYSTVAYQGARGLDPHELLAANAFAPVPDLLFLLDIPPDVGLARVSGRGDKADLFEDLDNLSKARAIFLNLRSPIIHLLDGRDPVDSLTQEIRRQVAPVLPGQQHSAQRTTPDRPVYAVATDG